MSAETNGCTYHEHADSQACNKVCDAGETLCPHHLLLQNAKKPKPPVREDGQRKYQTPRGYEQ